MVTKIKEMLMRRFWVLLILFLVALPMVGFSQVKDVSLYLDFARFRYDDEKSLLEIYYFIAPKNAEVEGERWFRFNLKNKENGEVLATKTLRVDFQKGDVEHDASTAKRGMLKSVLPTGSYVLELMQINNITDEIVDSVGYPLSIKPFVGDRVTLSDLEVCSNIIPNSPNKDSDYHKNGMDVLPNPTRIFSMSTPRVYYYIEMYNLNKKQHDDPYHIQVVVADKEGQVRFKKDYHRPRKYESLVERGAFDIRKLESGLYTLIFALTDSSENYSVYRRENFFVVNPKVVAVSEEVDEEGFRKSEYYTLPESIVDRMFEEAQYIATPDEVKIYKSLTNVEGKRKFMYNFWKKRTQHDPDFKDEYYARIEYANEHFSYAKTPGWKSDRGRVYILYGKPDQIDHYPSESNTLPYEVWFYYNIEGGVEFDFVDFSGFGDYKLVNSTKRNEYSDPNWRRLIQGNRF